MAQKPVNPFGKSDALPLGKQRTLPKQKAVQKVGRQKALAKMTNNLNSGTIRNNLNGQ